MNAFAKAQFEFDNRLPPPVSEDDLAETEWLDANAERLMDGNAVEWGYRKSDKGSVTPAQFADAVQQHLVQRQIDGEDKRDAFAQLVIANLVWGSRFDGRANAEYLMGSRTALKQIAVELLLPHAERAVALDQQWQRESEECGF
ncbi:hypothetical protein N5D61_24510 [Pseudomonas sp. GD03842]|uniref:hypothetical protein n=1 Tax=Pseudomonas sp. GD03842 TaxID=2975385 RepID=UPI0024483C41|nr:hypothetical protein [Pseudomonas sp. GD03842]MDH0749491.1 hypothetical protein [Pseudomonas sp. GD03842]